MKRIATWVLIFCAGFASAADPFAFAFQGVLRTAEGACLTQRNLLVTFRLYEGVEGGRALWGRQCPVLLDTNGLFNVTLGDSAGSAIKDLAAAPCYGTLAETFAAATNGTFYVGVEVEDSSGEMRPRTPLAAAPLAAVACNVRAASGDFSVSGRLTADTFSVASLATSGAFRVGALSTRADVAAGTVDVADKLLVASGGLAAGGGVTSVKGVTVHGTVSAETVTGAWVTVGGTLSAQAVTVTGNLRVNGANGFLPVGGIALWSGTAENIPAGWALCDGNNGTPDLRGRFIVGAGGTYALGAKGGADEVTLSVGEMPAHGHGLDIVRSGYTGSHNDKRECVGWNWNANVGDHTTSEAGGGQAHENRPPYYALCYIKKIR